MLNIILFLVFNSNFLMADNFTSKYTVKVGDCLYRIAEKYYNDGEKWRLIYNANSDIIKNPDLIYPDMTFSIPFMEENKTGMDAVVDSSSEYNRVNTSSDTVATAGVISSEINKNDDENDSDSTRELAQSDDDDLSGELPLTQAPFNVSENRIKVEKNFFDGKIVSGADKNLESNIFARGDTIKISLNKKSIPSEINLINIYMLIHKKKNYYIAEKVAECSNCVMSGNDLICIITDLSHSVEKGYPIKIWK
jgi:hypothetical protein